MIHHLVIFKTGLCEGLHSRKLNSANWIIRKYRKLHIRVCFDCLRAKSQFFLSHCRQLSFSATLQRVKRKIYVQKENKTTSVIKNEKRKKNSDYYYLSNRKVIEVVCSSRISLLAFYSSEEVLSAQVCSLASVSITVL